MQRDEAIKRIREALRRRSGKVWSVKAGRGTAWGWLTVDAPPARRTWAFELLPETPFTHDDGRPIPWEERGTWSPTGGHYTSPAERCELAALLDLRPPIHQQGVSIPPDSWEVYVRKAEGEVGVNEPEHHWD